MIYLVSRDHADFLATCERRGLIPDLEAMPVFQPYQLVGVPGRGNQFFMTALASRDNPHAAMLSTLVKEIVERAEPGKQASS